MRAAVYSGFGEPLRVQQVPDPVPGDDDVVVEVLATGLCRSDLHGWRGHDPDIVCPHVGGHEFCGRVVAAGSGVHGVRIGDRVVAPFVCGCGTCAPCRAGQHQVCRRQQQPGFTRWGSFAGLTTVPWPDVNAVPVPGGVDDVAAALVGCRVSTAYRGVVERGRLAAGEVLCVVGCGGVGLAAVALGRALGAEVVAVDVSPGALDLAQRLGATHLVTAPTGPDAAAELEEVVRQVSGGAHVSVDALGSPGTATSALYTLRPLGRHVQIGLFDAPLVPAPLSRVVRDELELLGVHGLSASRLPQVLDLVAFGRLDLAPLVSRRIALDDVPEALPAMAQGRPGVSVVTSL